MDHETAGDPLSGLKWTRGTTAKVAAELCKLGTDICARTVARLLKKIGFSLRVNHKKRAGASHPNRDDQFQHIAELRERCAVENTPVICVDTKKKELVGAFRNPGAKWDHSPELVNDHDFPSAAEGRAIPYGIYDPRANAGTVFVGQTADTPAFAVDCIEKWWRTEGHKHYPDAEALQSLADGGGSNSCTARAWKFNLQHRLCNRHGLRVTVAHYPPATSKWNPIEHSLFCEVSKNWAGRPLDSFETILKYLRTTRTATGLRVRAHLVRKTYKTGVKVTDAQMRKLRITPEQLPPQMERVRLFFVEYFRPCSWAFALTVAPSWVRSTGGQHSPPPVVGQPEQPSRPAHDAWVLRSAPPAAPGHSRGVLLRFHGKGDASAMAVVTTRLSGRAKQRLPEC